MNGECASDDTHTDNTIQRVSDTNRPKDNKSVQAQLVYKSSGARFRKVVNEEEDNQGEGEDS